MKKAGNGYIFIKCNEYFFFDNLGGIKAPVRGTSDALLTGPFWPPQ